MKVYIVTFKTEQQDTRIGAVYFTLDEAKAEADRLDSANSWSSAGVVVREAPARPRVWTEMQKRWLGL